MISDGAENQTVIEIGEGVLRVEGSQSFVESIIADLDLKQFLKSGAGMQAKAENFIEAEQPRQIESSATSGDSDLDAFDEVFAPTADGFQIIADVSENTTAKTARNVILLHLFGLQMTGVNEATDDDLRDVCLYHGCYDAGNFATHVKGMGNRITKSGSSRSYTVKLTAPGLRAAREFAQRIQGGN
jgi:hypothetical protein